MIDTLTGIYSVQSQGVVPQNRTEVQRELDQIREARRSQRGTDENAPRQIVEQIQRRDLVTTPAQTLLASNQQTNSFATFQRNARLQNPDNSRYLGKFVDFRI
ncbi:MAG: hypothetical protein JNL36_11370 [Candidatus Kapabacteria bacterium]|nr:hypothetical protein [Candidatus Kapabacteria bacterium]